MIVSVRHQAYLPYTQPELSPNTSLLSLLHELHHPLHFPPASEIAFAPCPHPVVAVCKYWHSLAISYKSLFPLRVPISESFPNGRICISCTVASACDLCFFQMYLLCHEQIIFIFFLIHGVQPLAWHLDITQTTFLWSSWYHCESCSFLLSGKPFKQTFQGRLDSC